MDENIKITPEEREDFVREDPPEFPKYTTSILNLANRNAKSTRRGIVGPMTDLVEEFQKSHPDGTYEDWVEFYTEEYDGEDRIQQGTEELVEMLEKMRKAMDEIDDEMAHQYIRELVLFKTYQGTSHDIKEVVLKKLSDIYNEEYRVSDEEGIHGYIGEVPVWIDKFDTAKKSSRKDVATVYVKEGRSDKSIEITSDEVGEALGVSYQDGELYKRIE